ncbi:YdcH family protein [Polyangium mundeleinium]|uniref:YdcH family protein n=1 Tax=Polyangium mundeleinium TaxID=2995306 RepID=A0ABT5EJJ0_9BACT|nr:YdcH family protein [Polyangium mundeleinium]MDC0741992.1 YdcH family protein [Polyangium mundeleinium]
MMDQQAGLIAAKDGSPHLEVGMMKREIETDSDAERLNHAEMRHRELEARLAELGRHAYLTPSEQLEMAELKKQKLKAKDEIHALRRGPS